MGQKVSFSQHGFCAKGKIKVRDQLENEEMDRFEKYLQVEKLKADLFDYCTETGITPSEFTSGQSLQVDTLSSFSTHKSVIQLKTPDSGTKTIPYIKVSPKDFKHISENGRKKVLKNLMHGRRWRARNIVTEEHDPCTGSITSASIAKNEKNIDIFNKLDKHQSNLRTSDATALLNKNKVECKEIVNKERDEILNKKNTKHAISSALRKSVEILPSSTSGLKPRLHSTLKPITLPPTRCTRAKPPCSREIPPLLTRDSGTTPRTFSRTRLFRRPLRRVTFLDATDIAKTSSSSEISEECAQTQSSSELSWSDESATEQQCNSNGVKIQMTGNEIGKNPCRALGKVRTSGTSDHRSPQSPIKWNGRCVYDSGYPSLIVGDRIESDDEQFWTKPGVSVYQKAPLQLNGSKSSLQSVLDALTNLHEEIRQLPMESKRKTHHFKQV